MKIDYQNRITSERIESLNDNQVFVFGSNLAGNHAGGAAKLAVERFGAEMGNGVGMQGSSYAIPTMQGGPLTMERFVKDFINYARCHKNLVFLVTKIGCGIAGFSVDDIAPLFYGAISIDNIYLPEEFWKYLTTHDRVIKSFKGFKPGLKCRNFQYEEGKEYEESGRIEACSNGFHACPHPLDVFSYYPPGQSKYHEVEQSGIIDDSESDKICSSKIKIGAEIGIPGLVRAAVEYVRSRCTNEHNAEPGKPVTAGDGEAATVGENGAATAGENGAATAGNYGAATSRGKSAVGAGGIAVVRGNDVMVKGGLGAVLVIVEENRIGYNIKEWKAVVVDGDNIKADTWYRLVDGELVEVEE